MKNQISDEIRENISIDTKEKFLKISKKLHKNLQQSNTMISLSLVQENLSKALGFRNFNELEKNLNVKKEIENKMNEDLMFESVYSNNLENFLNAISPQILTNLIIKENNVRDEMWQSRAKILINLISNILYKNVLNKNKFKSLELYKEFLVLDNLTKIYWELNESIQENIKTIKINMNEIEVELKVDSHIFKQLKDYITSIPNFNLYKPKQNDGVYEQHGFLVMQATKSIDDISNLDTDICVYHEDWVAIEKFKKNKYYYEIIQKIYNKIGRAHV